MKIPHASMPNSIAFMKFGKQYFPSAVHALSSTFPPSPGGEFGMDQLRAVVEDKFGQLFP